MCACICVCTCVNLSLVYLIVSNMQRRDKGLNVHQRLASAILGSDI